LFVFLEDTEEMLVSIIGRRRIKRILKAYNKYIIAMHLSFLLIPLITILVAYTGGRFTATAVKTWYRGLRKPSWTPPGGVIGAVWTVLYILAAISALVAWNLPSPISLVVATLFILNALVNVFWSYVFFYLHKMGPAIWVCLFLDLTIVLLIWFIAPLSPLGGWLLVPYAAWVSFASYLNFRVWEMNR
jgi:tryptophan-rich sensory protein